MLNPLAKVVIVPGRHHDHRIVDTVGDVQIAGGIESQSDGILKSGGERALLPLGCHLDHRAGPEVGDVEVSAVEGDAVRLIEPVGEGRDGGGGRKADGNNERAGVSSMVSLPVSNWTLPGSVMVSVLTEGLPTAPITWARPD